MDKDIVYIDGRSWTISGHPAEMNLESGGGYPKKSKDGTLRETES